jgi:hypothetical protein
VASVTTVYLTGAIHPTIRPEIDAGRVGALVTPRSRYRVDPAWTWAADSGCYSPATYVGDAAYLAWLDRQPRTALWVTCPDVVGDHAATVARSVPFAPSVRALGFVPAFVAQDGATPETVPWDAFGALFIGGSTAWKLGPAARALLAHARALGLPTHVGRVNSRRRFAAFHGLADTVDGTCLAFDPSRPVATWSAQLVLGDA